MTHCSAACRESEADRIQIDMEKPCCVVSVIAVWFL
jgi:hypothetical protein